MGQLYMQRFEYRGAIDKAAYDEAWGIAFKAMKETGNWGNVPSGVTHHNAWGTAWGGKTSVKAGGKTFSATSRSSFVSQARYTFYEAGGRQAPVFLSLYVPPQRHEPASTSATPHELAASSIARALSALTHLLSVSVP